MSANEVKASTLSASPTDPNSRIAELEKAISSLNVKLTIAAIVGVILGSGGLFGIVKISSEAKATDVNTVVTIQKQKIESLERSVKRLEGEGVAKDSEEVSKLKKRIEEAERQLREALEQFDSTTKALASNLGEIRDATTSIAKVTTDAAKVRSDLQEQIRSLDKSIQKQAAVVSEVKKEHADFVKQTRKKFDF